jgi:demethylmenaquinone methyltransferase/2-methoxy-6-polyprenyl-1,4-benzoquinol methylase
MLDTIMFAALVPRYDRFNRLASLGLDAFWRRKTARFFPEEARVLDVGAGTGDLAKALVDERRCRVAGVDPVAAMVEAARLKLRGYPGAQFQIARAEDLPFAAASFDGVASAFVIRNLHHEGVLDASLREFHRVLKPGGVAALLELTRPPGRLWSVGHRVYLKALLPLIGRAAFGRDWPGAYLRETIARFPAAHIIRRSMREAGFQRVRYFPLSRGIAGIFYGVRL